MSQAALAALARTSWWPHWRRLMLSRTGVVPVEPRPQTTWTQVTGWELGYLKILKSRFGYFYSRALFWGGGWTQVSPIQYRFKQMQRLCDSGVKWRVRPMNSHVKSGLSVRINLSFVGVGKNQCKNAFCIWQPASTSEKNCKFGKDPGARIGAVLAGQDPCNRQNDVGLARNGEKWGEYHQWTNYSMPIQWKMIENYNTHLWVILHIFLTNVDFSCFSDASQMFLFNTGRWTQDFLADCCRNTDYDEFLQAAATPMNESYVVKGCHGCVFELAQHGLQFFALKNTSIQWWALYDRNGVMKLWSYI